jgi:hypothetical protein
MTTQHLSPLTMLLSRHTRRRSDCRLGLVTLVLKPASTSRSFGEWNDDDFDVGCDGAAVVARPAEMSCSLRRLVVSQAEPSQYSSCVSPCGVEGSRGPAQHPEAGFSFM